MRLDPADAPAGHRPVLGEGVDEQDAVVRLHDVEEGRRAAAAIVEQRIDLVGDDPEIALRRARSRIACRVARSAVQPVGLDGELTKMRRGARRDRGRDPVDVAGPAIAGLVERRPAPACAPATPAAAGEIRPGRRQIDRPRRRRRRSPAAPAGSPACREPVTRNSSRRKALAEMPGVVAGQRLAQFRDAALPGVEGLAVAQRLGGGSEMKSGVGRSPSPTQSGIRPVAAAAIVDRRRRCRFRARRAPRRLTHVEDGHRAGSGLQAATADSRLSHGHDARAIDCAPTADPIDEFWSERTATACYFFASRSRISVSSCTSAGGGAAAGAGFSFSSRRRILFTALTIRKMIQARIRKLMSTVRKLP